MIKVSDDYTKEQIIMKKILFKIVSFILLAILLMIIVVPYLFKGEITTLLKEKLNEQIEGTVDFDDVTVNLFTDFPNIYVNVKDLKVLGSGAFEGKQVYGAESTALSINLKSAFDKSTPYIINQIKLVKPNINLYIPKVGKANYEIYESTEKETPTEAVTYEVALSRYEVIDGYVSYIDETSDIIFKTRGLNHSGVGNFTQDVFDLSTDNDFESLNLSIGGVDYVRDWSIIGDVNAKIDLPNKSYVLNDNVLKINNLDLAYSGKLKQLDNSGYNMDLDFNAPNNSLKSILSLIPSVYQDNFSSLDASGNTNLKGSAHGTYLDGKSYPAIDLHLDVKDGRIAYPDLPDPISRLNTSLKVKGQNPLWSDLSVNIPNLSMLIGSEQITGQIKIDNVMGNQDISAIVDGNINLAYLEKFVAVDGLSNISGMAKTHIELDAKYDDISSQNMDAVLFNTQVDATNVALSYEGYPDIKISRGVVTGSPQSLKLDNAAIQMGKSDVNIEFSMQNPLAYAIADQEVTSDLKITSKYLDADAFTGSEGSIQEVPVAQEESTSSEGYIENIQLNYSVDLQNVKYDGMNIKNIKSKGKFDDENTRVDQLDFKYEEIDFQTDGSIGNVYRYATYGEPTSAKFNVAADKIDLNAFTSDAPSESNDDAVSGVILVPKGIDATVNTKFNTLIYDDLEINNVSGALRVEDQIASLVGFQGNTLGGNVKIDGDYNTQVIDDPKYNFAYDINVIDFQQAFTQSNVFRRLAPIAKYIDGNFNSQSEFSGKIGENMLPDLNTLNAAGIFQTLNGVLLDFPVLDKIGNTLGIKELKRYEIKDSWNKFSVKDGAVNVEPFKFTKEEMNFSVAGSHSLENEMNYTISAEIPRTKLEKSNVTQVVNSGLDWISSQASTKGLNLDVGDYIYLDINVTGTITNPKVTIVPTGAGGKNLKDEVKSKVTDEVDKVKDKVMTKAEEELERRKKEAEERVNTEVDKAKAKAKEKIDEEVEKVKEQAKEKVKDVVKEQVVDTVSTLIKDKVGEKAKEVIDDKVGDVISDEKLDDAKKKAADRLKNIFGKKDDGGK